MQVATSCHSVQSFPHVSASMKYRSVLRGHFNLHCSFQRNFDPSAPPSHKHCCGTEDHWFCYVSQGKKSKGNKQSMFPFGKEIYYFPAAKKKRIFE